jgi:hypothetical protein
MISTIILFGVLVILLVFAVVEIVIVVLEGFAGEVQDSTRNNLE